MDTYDAPQLDGQFFCGGIMYWADPTGQHEVEMYDEAQLRWRRMTSEEFRTLDMCRYPRDYKK